MIYLEMLRVGNSILQHRKSRKFVIHTNIAETM